MEPFSLALLYQASFAIPAGGSCSSSSLPCGGWKDQKENQDVPQYAVTPALCRLRQEDCHRFRPHLGYSKNLVLKQKKESKQVVWAAPTSALQSAHTYCVEALSRLALSVLPTLC